MSYRKCAIWLSIFLILLLALVACQPQAERGG